jgi:alpha-mannosidase
VNKFPHSTFNWVGIDGTQVLCHMTPVGTIPLSVPRAKFYLMCRCILQKRTMRRRLLVIYIKQCPTTRYFQPSILPPSMAVVDNVNENLESSSSSLLVFGNGDGGGGPLAKMLESVRFALFFTLASMMTTGRIAPPAQRYCKHIAGTAGCASWPLS